MTGNPVSIPLIIEPDSAGQPQIIISQQHVLVSCVLDRRHTSTGIGMMRLRNGMGLPGPVPERPIMWSEHEVSLPVRLSEFRPEELP